MEFNSGFKGLMYSINLAFRRCSDLHCVHSVK